MVHAFAMAKQATVSPVPVADDAPFPDSFARARTLESRRPRGEPTRFDRSGRDALENLPTVVTPPPLPRAVMSWQPPRVDVEPLPGAGDFDLEPLPFTVATVHDRPPQRSMGEVWKEASAACQGDATLRPPCVAAMNPAPVQPTTTVLPAPARSRTAARPRVPWMLLALTLLIVDDPLIDAGVMKSREVVARLAQTASTTSTLLSGLLATARVLSLAGSGAAPPPAKGHGDEAER